MRKPSKTSIEPELYLRDGRIIRSLADAIALLREHEARPGVDVRDEVLHRLERTRSEEEWALSLLQEGVLVHPGYFFDFTSGAHLVVSLLVPEGDFARAAQTIARALQSV